MIYIKLFIVTQLEMTPEYKLLLYMNSLLRNKTYNAGTSQPSRFYELIANIPDFANYVKSVGSELGSIYVLDQYYLHAAKWTAADRENRKNDLLEAVEQRMKARDPDPAL